MWKKGKQEGLFKLRVPGKGVFTCSFENGLPAKNGKVEPYLPLNKGGSSVVIRSNGLSNVV